MGLYRLYIDEVGNHDLSHPEDENERFLSLTGVIIDAEYCLRSFNPSFEEIKRIFFAKDPDEPIIFHRKDIMNKRPPFQALRDPYIEKRFNETLLSSLSNWEYQVITVVIEKKSSYEEIPSLAFSSIPLLPFCLIRALCIAVTTRGEHR